MTVSGHRDPRMVKRYTHPDTLALAKRLDAEPAASDAGPPPCPADVLRRHLPAHKTIDQIAAWFEVPATTLSDLLAGQARIDVSLALQLERLGLGAKMWLDTQSAYDLWQQRRSGETPPTPPALRLVANKQ